MTVCVALEGPTQQQHTFLTLPKNMGLPDVIVWNRSVYTRSHTRTPPTGCNGPVYVQAFAWWMSTEGG